MSQISCVIVCYNNSKYIQKAIESVLNQTRVPDEIIVADDCSTDDSINIIRGLAEKNSIIKLILREKNVGVAANRDIAVRFARCPVVTTLDGDDWYYPEKIESEMRMLAGSDTSVVYSNYTYVDENDVLIRRIDLEKFSRLGKLDRIMWAGLRKGLLPRDMMLTKKLYEQVGGLDHNLKTHEDWDLKLRLLMTDADWKFNPGEGTAYRRSDYGLSRRGRVKRCASQFYVVRKNKRLLWGEIGFLSICNIFIVAFIRSIRILLKG